MPRQSKRSAIFLRQNSHKKKRVSFKIKKKCHACMQVVTIASLPSVVARLKKAATAESGMLVTHVVPAALEVASVGFRGIIMKTVKG
jgi:hypothetical protein